MYCFYIQPNNLDAFQQWHNKTWFIILPLLLFDILRLFGR